MWHDDRFRPRRFLKVIEIWTVPVVRGTSRNSLAAGRPSAPQADPHQTDPLHVRSRPHDARTPVQINQIVKSRNPTNAAKPRAPGSNARTVANPSPRPSSTTSRLLKNGPASAPLRYEGRLRAAAAGLGPIRPGVSAPFTRVSGPGGAFGRTPPAAYGGGASSFGNRTRLQAARPRTKAKSTRANPRSLTWARPATSFTQPKPSSIRLRMRKETA